MGLIVAGKEFEVEARIINWRQSPFWDSHSRKCIHPSHPCAGGVPFSPKLKRPRTNRFAMRPLIRKEGRNPSLAAVQSVVRQFVIHHDGCPSAKVCFNVLHNERGLSCHFLIDNDGTIYQTLDIAYMGFHAAGFNASSIGIELCNRGDAKKYPTYYSKRGQSRDVTACKIHGHTYLAFEYTKAQYEAFQALARTLQRALPNLPTEFPQSAPGQQAWTVLDNPKRFSGYLGHYHTTRRKWDPGPFDFKLFLGGLRGRMSFPLIVRGDTPEVPQSGVDLAKDAAKLYKANEESGQGGFFPVGPFGESRLWHGGIHLHGKKATPVHTPFAGRVVAARMGGTSSVGSTNFALVRHDLNLGENPLRFYSLYFHLLDESSQDNDEKLPGWARSDAYKAQKKRGRTILIDEPVEAGDVVGHMGMAGPAEQRSAQFHFEIFSADEMMAQIGATSWTVVDGTAGGRYAKSGAVVDPIDIAPRDGKLSRSELLGFFRKGQKRNIARYYATLHVSEWIDSPSWTDSLAAAPDYQHLPERDIQRLVDDQITPTLWWTDKVARHAKLPRDGVVFHYHPVTFIRTINEKLIEAEIEGGHQVDAADAAEQPDDVLGDIDDEAGDSFVDDAELKEADFGSDLTLRDLAGGFAE